MAQAEYLIHDLAERAGVTVRTIRYYADEGLLPDPILRGKYAYYADTHLERLRLIQQMKDLHFSLREIREAIQTTPADLLREKLTPPRPAPAPAPAVRPSKKEAPPSPAERSMPSPGSSALDYIHRIADFRTEMRPQAPSPNQPPASYSLSEQPPASPGEQESWRRVILAPGVELHLREPVLPETEGLVQQIIALTKKTFYRKP
jgi:DNA-binding transcriptional MerR regulator